MRIIRYLYWNVCKKNLIKVIVDIIYKNDIDIVALVEADKIDSNYLISELHKFGINFKINEIDPKGEEIKLFSKNNLKISAFKEENHYSIYKTYDGEDMYLLFVVHLLSAMYKNENARDSRAQSLSKVFNKIEEEIFKESSYKSIVIGDFNLHPFSSGIIGINGFNAVFSKDRAYKISRTVDEEKRLFYYNPMWKFMADDRNPQGTYYNTNDESDKSFYWYMFDQILIRPFLIERFIIDELEIISKINDAILIKNGKIDNIKYSDHLPIKFEIR